MTRALLEGKVALVTGGARGIGFEIARMLHRHGASVVIADNGASIGGDEEDATAAGHAVDTLGHERAEAFREDLSIPGHGEAAVSLACSRFGGIDIVINNAAILRDGFIFKTRRDDWERVLAVNLHAPFEILAAATPRMRDQTKAGRAPGRIVNIVSTAGIVGNFAQSAYASAKAGLIGLTRVVAMDLARSAITCNAVAPFAATRVTDSIQPANDAQAQYKARALRIPPGYVARLVTALSLPSNVFTGQLFGVRGRELFLYAQAHPDVRVVGDTLERQDALALGGLMEAEFNGRLADLTTDLELFNTEPLI